MRSALFRDLEYDKVRFTYTRKITGSSSVVDTNYSEGAGSRYYFNILGTTASQSMEAATFRSFISVTMSGSTSHTIDLVPLLPGELVYFDTRVTAVNKTVSKGFVASTDAGFYHTGTQIKAVGGSASITYNIKKDFATASIAFLVNGTQSIGMTLINEPGESLDWDLFVSYQKSYSKLLNPITNTAQPIYPSE